MEVLSRELDQVGLLAKRRSCARRIHDSQAGAALYVKRSNGYSHQLEHVDSLRNKFINRSVSFICRESRAERPRMWSAFYLSMLDLDKTNQDDSHDYTNYLVMEYLVRALAWDSAPIGDNNPPFHMRRLPQVHQPGLVS